VRCLNENKKKKNKNPEELIIIKEKRWNITVIADVDKLKEIKKNSLTFF
jgi:hypothetical protein